MKKRARINKAIGKKKLEEQGYPGKIKRLISGKNGACYASIIIGILLELPEPDIALNLKKFKAGFGKPVSDKQLKAVNRLLYGRHYEMKALEVLDYFYDYPEIYAKEHFHADKIRVVIRKPAICVNLIREAEQKARQEQAGTSPVEKVGAFDF